MIRWMMNEIHAEKYLKIFDHQSNYVIDDVLDSFKKVYPVFEKSTS